MHVQLSKHLKPKIHYLEMRLQVFHYVLFYIFHINSPGAKILKFVGGIHSLNGEYVSTTQQPRADGDSSRDKIQVERSPGFYA